jgi:hypothetical protein
VIRRNTGQVHLKVDGDEVVDDKGLHMKLPQTTGVARKQFTLSW